MTSKPRKPGRNCWRLPSSSRAANGIDNGYATHWSNSGDLVATTWNHILWSWGGELWDPATYKVEGVLNNDAGVAALQFAQELYKTAPDGASGFGFDETVGTMCNGSTAMIEIWYGFGGAFTNADTCAQSANLGYRGCSRRKRTLHQPGRAWA